MWINYFHCVNFFIAQFWSLKYFVVLKRDYQPSSLIFCYYKAHDNLGFVKIQMIRLLGYI